MEHIHKISCGNQAGGSLGKIVFAGSMDGHAVYTVGRLPPGPAQGAFKLPDPLLQGGIVTGHTHAVNIVDMEHMDARIRPSAHEFRAVLGHAVGGCGSIRIGVFNFVEAHIQQAAHKIISRTMGAPE